MFLIFFFMSLLSSTQGGDNWAVLVDSSKFYSNYRHTVNTLLIYQMLKKYGFDDDHIIVMLPENHQCHPRNPFPGKIYDGTHSDNLMIDLELDYVSAEVSPDSLTNLLIGRHPPDFPYNKRLNSNKNSKVFLYLTGHGGNGYFKIQDTQVLKSADLAYAVYEMFYKERFEELLIFIDSCQSMSMFNYIDLPGVHMLSSSVTGQPSKSYGSHAEIGLTTSDHFSMFFAMIFRTRSASAISKMTLENVIEQLPESVIKSTIGFKSRQKPYEILMADFITTKHNTPDKLATITEEVEAKTWKFTEIKEEMLGENKVEHRNFDKGYASLLVLLIGTGVFYITNLY